MDFKSCPACGLCWLNGVPHWSHKNTPTTAANAREIVCKYAKRPGCINPEKDMRTPATDTWEKRRAFLDGLEDKITKGIQRLDMEK